MNIAELDARMLAEAKERVGDTEPFAPWSYDRDGSTHGLLAAYLADKATAHDVAEMIATTLGPNWRSMLARRPRNEALQMILAWLADAACPPTARETELSAVFLEETDLISGWMSIQRGSPLWERSQEQDALVRARSVRKYIFQCGDLARGRAFALFFALCEIGDVSTPAREVWEAVSTSSEAVEFRGLGDDDWYSGTMVRAGGLAVRLLGDFVPDPEKPLSPHYAYGNVAEPPAASAARNRLRFVTEYGDVFAFAVYAGCDSVDRGRAECLRGHVLAEAARLFCGTRVIDQ